MEIGRVYALQGDTAKAKAAYQDFLTLWKDADKTLPSSSLRKRSTRSSIKPRQANDAPWRALGLSVGD